MNVLASSGQLRASFLRWALFIVPAIILLGMLSAMISGSSPDNPWFAALEKPSAYPPPATFSIVWTVLYIMLGLALAMIFAARGAPGRNGAIVVFVIQFLVNLAWAPLFFGGHQITSALILLCLLDVLVVITVAMFWRVRPLAALLLVPYLAWILFATYLNWELSVANPGFDGQAVSGATQRFEF